MNQASLNIDRIVRQVIAELENVGRIANPSHKTAPKKQDTLVIDCQVVTLSEISGRLGNIRRVTVPPRAVVTPAVRDELRRRNVSLEFALPEPNDSIGRVRLVAVTAGKRFDPAALIRHLEKERIDVENRRSDCLIAATGLLASEVNGPDTLGLLLARETAAALCLANRHRGVRAVSATDAPAVSAAKATVGANLLVINPAAITFHQLKQLVTEFCSGGARDCPEVFREQLA